jgi:hypothetical protein
VGKGEVSRMSMTDDEKLVMRALATGLLAVDAGRRAGWAQTYDLQAALDWVSHLWEEPDDAEEADENGRRLGMLARQMLAAEELKLHPEESIRSMAERLSAEWDCSVVTAHHIIHEVKRQEEAKTA